MRCLAGHKSEVNITTNLSMTISKSNDATEQRQKRIISQMAKVNYRNKHRRMQNIRHSSTGHWLIDTHEYKSWRDCKISCAMSCYGICELGWSSFLVEYWVVFAGSGKSVSISSRIDGSNSIFLTDTAVAYYYFDYADKRTLSPSSLFTCISQQLLRSLKQISDALVEALEADHSDGAVCPEVHQMIALLVKIIDEFSSVAIFIDGSDELLEADRKLTFSSLRSILTTVVGPAKLFVSNREDTTYLFSKFAHAHKMQTTSPVKLNHTGYWLLHSWYYGRIAQHRWLGAWRPQS